MDQQLSVSGMSCSGCAQAVETALEELTGVTAASADHTASVVRLTTDEPVSDANIQAAIEAAGYEVTG